MRQRIIIGNWKMNLSLKESISLASEVQNQLVRLPDKIEVVVCPSYTAIPSIQPFLTTVKLGAQDCCWEENGPFTGEVSAHMLKELGCQYVIVGHSERRVHCAETDQVINKKVKAALNHQLTPIVCLGETEPERDQNLTEVVILEQLKHCLDDVKLTGNQSLIIAYEPLWAIGSGTPVQAGEPDRVNKMIRHSLLDYFASDVINTRIRTIYGGSVKASNVEGFTDQGTEDGILVGGASLKSSEFVRIVKRVAI